MFETGAKKKKNERVPTKKGSLIRNGEADLGRETTIFEIENSKLEKRVVFWKKTTQKYGGKK